MYMVCHSCTLTILTTTADIVTSRHNGITELFIHDVLSHKLTRKVSKRSGAVWETYMYLAYVSCTNAMVYTKIE